MNEAIAELVDTEEFFAPASTDMIDSLMGIYEHKKAQVEQMAKIVAQMQDASVLDYFGDDQGNSRTTRTMINASMFDLPRAMQALYADFWDRALKMTDVLDFMPQKRRTEWYESIQARNTPEFTEENVRSTITDLLLERGKFFAERVDGIFRSLSPTHLTNTPEGFRKRMILRNATDKWGTVNWQVAGVINDLRAVIARFMGRDEPGYGSTTVPMREAAKHNGCWTDLDGGALRIRMYGGVGTAHLEVHPEMAWRLNSVLASLYPEAIPSKFRKKPKRKPRDVTLFDRPLPFAVLNVLGNMEQAKRLKPEEERRTYHGRSPFVLLPNTLEFSFCGDNKADKHLRAEVKKVLMAIGAVPKKMGNAEYFQFDYDPSEVVGEIICRGCIPDQKAYQYYPTQKRMIERVKEEAINGATPGMRWCEPQAGTGALTSIVPEGDFLQCYEISELHCQVLRSKGITNVDCIDFLKVPEVYGDDCFDRIVMNPPFDRGQWLAHVEHAASMLKVGGKLVAILPEGAQNKDFLPGYSLQWSRGYQNEFAGTSIGVVILTCERTS